MRLKDMKKVLFILIMVLIGLSGFADSNSGGQTELNNLFIEACKFASLTDAVKYYELGADINSLDNFGWSALMWASQEGYTDIVKYLIENKADINYADITNGWTALIAACFKGHADIVSLLIEGGADVNPDVTGFRNTSSPLRYAERFGHSDIAEMLIQAGAE
jgi:uncharacterized protein